MKKSSGRQKIEIKKLNVKSRRQVTFSKRRAGLFNKAAELSILSGAEIAILVFSSTGKIYTFGHPNVDMLIDRFLTSNFVPTKPAEAYLPLEELNRDLKDATAEFEIEKMRAERMRNTGGFWWDETEMECMGIEELKRFRSSLMELRGKVAEKVEELAAVNQEVLITSPSFHHHATTIEDLGSQSIQLPLPSSIFFISLTNPIFIPLQFFPMAKSPFLLLPAILLHFFLSADPISPNPLITPSHRAMVLPLYLSSSNSSKFISNPHRHLRQFPTSDNRSNARMRLYDDLLLNGYYTTRLWIGTPPQQFALIVDTGSTVTYVPCSTCEQCGRHQDPKFDPESSSTYKPIKCNIDCTCDSDGVQCVYERQYAEMSTSSGVLGEDVISFGNQSELIPQRAVFGCENMETGDLFSQRADGIMGLGTGDLSLVDQLVEKGAINDSFSLCYGGMDIGGGAMVLGGISPPSDMIFTYSDPFRDGNSPYYNVDLKEIHVAGKKLPLSSSIFDGRYGTVLDSGTTYAYLPAEAFGAFKDAVSFYVSELNILEYLCLRLNLKIVACFLKDLIMDELHSLKKIDGPDPNFKDICFSGAGSDAAELSNIFPTVDMVFENGQKLSLAPENYFFRHSKVHGAYCLGIFENGNDQTTLLGGIVVRNTLVMYDRAHSKIGFWKTNCSELWERLRTSDDNAHAPSISTKSHGSDMAPASAPIESPHYTIPGELQIGRITFEILLNKSYTDLEPHITELSDHIAQELNVSHSQVLLLNFTMRGNDSLIKLAIIPYGSSEIFSHATVNTIISKIVEHHMQLPPTFGSYQVVRWNVEPPMERSMWKRLYVLVGLAIIVIFILGLSALGAWFILRSRQQAINSYKPVNAAVPEQELQPLCSNLTQILLIHLLPSLSTPPSFSFSSSHHTGQDPLPTSTPPPPPPLTSFSLTPPSLASSRSPPAGECGSLVSSLSLSLPGFLSFSLSRSAPPLVVTAAIGCCGVVGQRSIGVQWGYHYLKCFLGIYHHFFNFHLLTT
uniref:Aspartic proteinase CDR1-like n=1 Tax=Cucumis melo TaxID=3656 RepID=A0A9I9DMM2_CUCME